MNPESKPQGSEQPRKVCLCGSSKWPMIHHRVMMDETLAGRIVIPMGLYGHADYPTGAKAATNDGDENTEVKQMLDRLHYAKIDVADEILVVRVNGYIGSSTRREIEHATSTGKPVRYFDTAEPLPNPSADEEVERLVQKHCGSHYELGSEKASVQANVRGALLEQRQQHNAEREALHTQIREIQARAVIDGTCADDMQRAFHAEAEVTKQLRASLAEKQKEVEFLQTVIAGMNKACQVDERLSHE